MIPDGGHLVDMPPTLSGLVWPPADDAGGPVKSDSVAAGVGVTSGAELRRGGEALQYCVGGGARPGHDPADPVVIGVGLGAPAAVGGVTHD